MRPPPRATPVTMKQHDQGQTLPNALAQETVDSVRRALERHVRCADAEPATELRMALHDLAREARQKAVSPEQVLVTLKHIWRSLPEIESARNQMEQTRVLQCVVSVCIKEYFAD